MDYAYLTFFDPASITVSNDCLKEVKINCKAVIFCTKQLNRKSHGGKREGWMMTPNPTSKENFKRQKNQETTVY